MHRAFSLRRFSDSFICYLIFFFSNNDFGRFKVIKQFLCLWMNGVGIQDISDLSEAWKCHLNVYLNFNFKTLCLRTGY